MEARELQSPEAIAAESKSARQSVEHKCSDHTPRIDSKAIYHDYRWYWFGRRTQDIILSFIALLALWPFMLLIALIVWIDSPGASPIFTQTRIGRKGKPFKFRNLRWMEKWCRTHKTAGCFSGYICAM